MRDPERYGVVEFDDDGTRALASRRSPSSPRSDYAVTGLYFYDNDVVDIAARAQALAARRARDHRRQPTPTSSGATSRSSVLGRGMAWLDTGTFESLMDASQFVHVVEARQGLKVACVEEIAWRAGWIDDDEMRALGADLAKSGYGDYLLACLARGRTR